MNLTEQAPLVRLQAVLRKMPGPLLDHETLPVAAPTGLCTVTLQAIVEPTGTEERLHERLTVGTGSELTVTSSANELAFTGGTSESVAT